MEKEFTMEQLEQLDAVYSAVHELVKVLLNDEDHDGNMEDLGEIAEFAAEHLVRMGYKNVYFPYEETTDDGDIEIHDYYELDEE